MSVLRATFEAVYSGQERFRKHLDELIEENRPIKDSVERDLFMKELAYSTLGLGNDNLLVIHSKDGALIRKDIETFARWLCYQDKKEIKIPYTLNKNDSYSPRTYQISFLWKHLRDNLFTVFPLALKQSISMSREQESTQKMQGFQIGGKNEE